MLVLMSTLVVELVIIRFGFSDRSGVFEKVVAHCSFGPLPSRLSTPRLLWLGGALDVEADPVTH